MILETAQVHWLTRDLIAVPRALLQTGSVWTLQYDGAAGLEIEAGDLRGGKIAPLATDGKPIPPEVAARFPHLRDAVAFRLDIVSRAMAPEMLKGQLAVTAHSSDGRLLLATGVQIPGVLDDLFAYDGPLGPVITPEGAEVRLWAPTAIAVRLRVGETPNIIPMAEDRGVWTAALENDWIGQSYLFEVFVYAPSTGRIEANVVTDPYSVGLTLNSKSSRFVDLHDPASKPEGWDQSAAPPLERFADLSFYELHIRDFSISDSTVPEPHRGTYLAFTHPESNGMRHLKALADAGLKAVHLLPSFDFATVDEDKSKWKETEDLSPLPPDSEAQQAAVTAIQADDGFNWGYDPLHYTTPEGSYAVDPDKRTLEYRAMVQALHRAGLRVVADVVYNHTHASGQAPTSVLDRIVPGYYHRLDENGKVLTTTCCANTASEHRMMEKLMADSIVTWTREYRIDAFRFDLMGHHMVSNLRRVRAALDALTPERDGVDGRKVYLYGEGWNFGEVANNARGVNAQQLNLFGEGVGTFNDRMRDAVRGGSAFGDPREAGWATGKPDARSRDLILTALAGNLRDFEFAATDGKLVKGGEVRYGGGPAGYAASPVETINYAAAHDNETLWDAVQMKAPADASVEERVRMNNLAVSVIALGQGLPFFHAGDDLLRSKSLDRNSFDSGDWFNRLDFSAQTNNWGVGLPLRKDNGQYWAIQKPLLADPRLRATPAQIRRARDHFREILAVRAATPQLRLGSAEEIQKQVRFLPGSASAIVMLIGREVLVVFNASMDVQEGQAEELAGLGLELHPVLQQSTDPVVQRATYADDGTISVPGLTAAVFVKKP